MPESDISCVYALSSPQCTLKFLMLCHRTRMLTQLWEKFDSIVLLWGEGWGWETRAPSKATTGLPFFYEWRPQSMHYKRMRGSNVYFK